MFLGLKRFWESLLVALAAQLKCRESVCMCVCVCVFLWVGVHVHACMEGVGVRMFHWVSGKFNVINKISEKVASILAETFGTKLRNTVNLDNTSKMYYQILRVF